LPNEANKRCLFFIEIGEGAVQGAEVYGNHLYIQKA
jgi:hypothetical protein